MKNAAGLTFFCALLALCSAAAKASPWKKMERCRKMIAANSHHRALDCFADVMAEGGAEEKKVASRFLEILAGDYSYNNVPSLKEVRTRIRLDEALVLSQPSSPSSVATAVIYHGRRPEAEEAPALAAARPRARKAPAKPQARPAFVVDDISSALDPSALAETGGAKTPVQRMVGSGFAIRENESQLRPVAAASKIEEFIEVTGFAFKEDEPSTVKASGDARAFSPEQPGLSINSVGASDLEAAAVAVAGAETTASGFRIYDDISPQAAGPLKAAAELRFEENSVSLGAGQLAILAGAAEQLRPGALRVRVKGFSGPQERKPEKLARVRAEVVCRILARKMKIPRDRLVCEWGIGLDKSDQRVLLLQVPEK
jgi:hypothetical protein